MIKTVILLSFRDGTFFSYANKYLKPKTGDDGYKGNADAPTPLKAGVPEACYYYTGNGTDTYEKQTEPGMAKKDYETLLAQIGGTGLMEFPEKTENHEPTTTLIRSNNNGLTNSRLTFRKEDLVSVKLDEKWVRFPGSGYDKESSYTFPKSSPNFRGLQESKEPPLDAMLGKGPNFDEFKDRKYEIIPLPKLEKIPGSTTDVNVLNENDYESVVKKVVNTPVGVDKYITGIECYGILKDGRKSGISYISLS